MVHVSTSSKMSHPKKTAHQKACDILKGNPLWKDYIGDEKVAEKYHAFRNALAELTPEQKKVNPLHEVVVKFEKICSLNEFLKLPSSHYAFPSIIVCMFM
jgi:hypothetical protein